MLERWKAAWIDEAGQDLAEYALLIALIALVVIGAVTLFGNNLNQVFTTIANTLVGVGGS